MIDEKAVVSSYVEAFNRGDLEGICRTFTADAEIWGVLGSGRLSRHVRFGEILLIAFKPNSKSTA